jgi:hypothetical protein
VKPTKAASQQQRHQCPHKDLAPQVSSEMSQPCVLIAQMKCTRMQEHCIAQVFLCVILDSTKLARARRMTVFAQSAQVANTNQQEVIRTAIFVSEAGTSRTAVAVGGTAFSAQPASSRLTLARVPATRAKMQTAQPLEPRLAFPQPAPWPIIW